MVTIFLAIAMELARPKLSPEAADAYVLAAVATHFELPEPLPPELGPALSRFWVKEQLWDQPFNFNGQAGIKYSIEWTRQHWPNRLPRIEEAERLPKGEEVEGALVACRWIKERLDLIAAVAPPWEDDNVDYQTREIEAHLRLCRRIQDARRGGDLIRQREAIEDVRLMIGDEVWFSGAWPPLFPVWRVPKSVPQ